MKVALTEDNAQTTNIGEGSLQMHTGFKSTRENSDALCLASC